jgi:hypothetical protein
MLAPIVFETCIRVGKRSFHESFGVSSDGGLGEDADRFLGSSVPFDNSLTVGM